MKKHEFHVSSLYLRALNIIENPEPILDKDVTNCDLTDEFMQDIFYRIKYRQSVNICINGNVRTGKSTVGIALGVYVTKCLIDLEITNNEFNIWNIARTQYELGMKMKDPRLNNTCVVIDEFDGLENTGENSTINMELLNHFSKIQAGRYVHKIYCTPSEIPDSESNIILNVVAADKVNGLTNCKVYIRVLKGTNIFTQLVGYANIDVNAVIKEWKRNNVEELFYSQSKTPKTIKTIEKARQKDFYVDYMVRKFEKMDMINSLGIFRTKDLDYADMIWQIYQEIKPTAIIGGYNAKEI